MDLALWLLIAAFPSASFLLRGKIWRNIFSVQITQIQSGFLDLSALKLGEDFLKFQNEFLKYLAKTDINFLVGQFYRI